MNALKNIKTIVLVSATALSLLVGVMLGSPYPVYASNCPSGQTEVSTNLTGNATPNSAGTYCVPQGNSQSGVQGSSIFALLVSFIKFLSVGVGIAVAGGIIYGGILFVTARGNSSQTQKGVTTIVNSVIGLLLYIFMFAILNFVIPGGIFQ